MTTTTTITLAVPTPFAVDPARLVAWLAAHHWTVVHGDEHCKMWMRTAPSGMSGHICLFNDLSHPHWREGMASTVTIVARTEGLEPHALAALLASAWVMSRRAHRLAPNPFALVLQRAAAVTARLAAVPQFCGQLVSLAVLGADTPSGVYWSGRLTLCAEPDDLPRYDAAFAAWRDTDPRKRAEVTTPLGSVARRGRGRKADAAARDLQAAIDQMEAARDDLEKGQAPVQPQARARELERLGDPRAQGVLDRLPVGRGRGHWPLRIAIPSQNPPCWSNASTARNSHSMPW